MVESVGVDGPTPSTRSNRRVFGGGSYYKRRLGTPGPVRTDCAAYETKTLGRQIVDFAGLLKSIAPSLEARPGQGFQYGIDVVGLGS